MSVNTVIKQAREQKNYSQEYVANKLGISQNAYSRLENGHTKLDFEKAIKLSEVLEKNPSDFLPKEFSSIHFNSNNNQDVVKNAYILNEYQKESLENVLKLLKEELDAVRKEREEERQKLFSLLERLALK